MAIRISQLDMKAFEAAPKGLFGQIKVATSKQRIRRLVELGLAVQVAGIKEVRYKLADVNAACGSRKCSWVGLCHMMARKQVVESGLNITKHVCPDCGEESYFQLKNANLEEGSS